MKNVILALYFVVLLALAGCTTSEPEQADTPAPPTFTPRPTTAPTPEIEGNPERGSEIFENGGAHEDSSKHTCAKCHSLDGSEGDGQFDGPSMRGISERASERVSGLSAEEYIRQSIMDPKAYIVEDYQGMGSINSLILSEEEVDDLVAFLLTQ